MDITEAMENRHSVRSYLPKPIENEKTDILRKAVEKVNAESGLHIQLQTNEKNGFSGVLAHYGSFDNVENYFVLTGKKDMDREIGYYGEKLVLLSQMLGLNTCWVAVTFNKKKAVYTLYNDEKLYVVISLGYGKTQGVRHKDKKITEVSDLNDTSPEWYRKGVLAALNAPTAINQQKFRFTLEDGKVCSKAGIGMYTDMDLGIAQYHFDAAVGKNHFGLNYEMPEEIEQDLGKIRI